MTPTRSTHHAHHSHHGEPHHPVKHKPRSRHVHPSELDAGEIEDLWAFVARFAAQDRAGWQRRLVTSHRVLRWFTVHNQLAACAVVHILEVPWQGRVHALFYTGSTAIDPRWRGHNLIQRAGLQTFVHYRLTHPTTPTYWLFVAATIKSYLLMTRNLAECWPRRAAKWPQREAALVDAAMQQMGFDEWWSAQTGILSAGPLYREGQVSSGHADLRDPDIAFYAEMNPGQDQGDGLVCLAPLSLRNWSAIVAKMARRGLGRRRRPSGQVEPAA